MYMRHINIAGLSDNLWESEKLSSETRAVLQAYSDGINDFVNGVSLTGSGSGHTARLLPPEFLTFGINSETWQPWRPQDSLKMIRLISFHLTWNWVGDLTREALRQNHPDLELLLEEITPFTHEFFYSMAPVLDDDDLKRAGMFSEETLVERYKRAAKKVKEASPPLT